MRQTHPDESGTAVAVRGFSPRKIARRRRRAEPAPRLPGELLIASYNIHIGIGRDGIFMPSRIAAVINELDADIVALQEVETGPPGFHMLDYLQQACHMEAIAAPTMVTPSGNFGNAILTRHCATTVRRLNLSLPHREPRGALDVEFDCGGRALRVVATHLGLRPAERRKQIQYLLKALPNGASVPTVLLGDLNEWFLWGRPVRWMHRWFKRAPAPATFPSGKPLFALDRVWVHPRSALRRVGVHVSAQARLGSDHLPLTAIIDLTEGA